MTQDLDREIDRVATTTIIEYGAEAAEFAVWRQQHLRGQGDSDGALLWNEVARRIDALMNRPENGLN